MSALAAHLAGDAVLGVASATGLAARFAPVPGLLPAAELLGAIVVLCRQVKVNRCVSHTAVHMRALIHLK
jgi:hypothetical protein